MNSLPAADRASAKLSGPARDILDGYQVIQESSLATVAGEIRSTNSLVSYFAIRRANRDNILGAEQVRSIMKSSEPLHRAAGAPACNQAFGPKATEYLMPLMRDSHPAVLDAVLDALGEIAARTETGKTLLEILPRLPASLKHKAMRLLGKLKYRPAVGLIEEIFQRRDSVDSPVACEVLVAIQGRAFLDGITEYLYPDNPIELHRTILECMAQTPSPVYYTKSAQLLKTLRNKQAVNDIVRRLALWSTPGVELAITLLGSSDQAVADAAQEGLVRHLRSTGILPPGFLHRLSKSGPEKGKGGASSPQGSDGAATASLPPHLEELDARLRDIFSIKPDADFQQLFFMSLTGEKHFLKPKLVHLAAARWGEDASKCIDAALRLGKDDVGLLRGRLQSRWVSHAEQHSQNQILARLIESVGAAGLKSPVREITKYLEGPNLPVQMAAAGTLAFIGEMREALEMEKHISSAHWMLKRKIAVSLSLLSRENPVAGLFKLCEDAEPLVRIAAVRSLEGVPHEKAYNVLLKSLHDPDERVRSSACVCLKGFAERKEVQAKLFEMLSDTDARVRANTVEALESVLSRDLNELKHRLKPFLTDPNARVVINAAKALFPAEPDLCLPVLETYLRAPDVNLRAGALWALGRLRRPDAFLCLYFHSIREKDSYVKTFVDKGMDLMKDHVFYRDVKYLLVTHQTGGLS